MTTEEVIADLVAKLESDPEVYNTIALETE